MADLDTGLTATSRALTGRTSRLSARQSSRLASGRSGGVPQTKRDIEDELRRLEHEITQQGRSMFKNEGSKSQFSITEAQEESDGTQPKKVYEHKQQGGKRAFRNEGDGNGERSSEYARILAQQEDGRLLHKMETGLSYYGTQHVGLKGKSGVANMEGGLAGDSTGRDASMTFLGATGAKNPNKTQSSLTSRGGVMPKTGRDSDMDRRLYYGRSTNTKPASRTSEAPFHTEAPEDPRFKKQV